MAWLRALFVLLLLSTTAFADGVNAVIGDASWIARFGVAPDASAAEDARLHVHLEYVEALLRARGTDGLTDAQRAARMRNLDLLRVYIERGEFPRNFEVQGRRPHFIDDDGRICAVGFLVAQTAGRAAAEAINREHEWDFIGDVRGIDAWVGASGLTVEELAMIQPSYGFQRPVPPPAEPSEVQRRKIIVALSSARLLVARCSSRFESWSETVAVSVFVSRRRVSVNVGRAGGRAFRDCVQSVLEAMIARRGVHGPNAFPMTVPFVYTVRRAVRNEDDRFAQPPPST